MPNDDATTLATQIVELSTDRCWELLESKSVGRLAVGGPRPDIFPVNYRISDGQVVIQTAEGMKLVTALGHHVAFEVDSLDETAHTGWSVVIRGEANEPKFVEQYLSAEDLEIGPWAAGEKRRFIVITPMRVSGRQIGSDQSNEHT